MKNIRRKRWAAGVAAAVLVYTVAGFWLVPAIIKNQVPKIGQSELQRRASIGEVRFNPYTLRLEAENLQLAEADGAPLFAVGKLAVEMQWRSLVRRAWSFAEIRVTAPGASLAIAQDGKFNLAEFLATLARRPRDPDPKPGLPRLIIGHFALEQGKVDMRDQRAGYNNSFTPIDFTLDNFSTLPDQEGPYTFTAVSARGGKLHWKGEASFNPIHGSGEFVLENASLPELGVYLKSYTRATVAAGELNATLPYRFAYADGKLEASLAGAKVSLRKLGLSRAGASDSFATLTRLEITGIAADLARREATVDQVLADGGTFAVKRDPKGALDLADLMIAAAAPAKVPLAPVVVNNWKATIKQVVFDQVALSAVDETVSPPLKVSAAKVGLRLQLVAQQSGPDLKVNVSEAGLTVADLTLASGAQTPFNLAQFGFSGGTVDLAARRAGVERLHAEGGQMQLTRDAKGQLNLLNLMPKFAATKSDEPASAGAPWNATAKSVELDKFSADVEDQGSGVKVHVQDIAVKLEGAGSDLKQPVKFTAGLSLREGGQLSAQGKVTPASGAMDADVRVKQLALAPLQPMLAKYVKLKLAGGSASAQGKLTAGTGGPKNAALRYVGRFEVANLALNEQSGEVFAAWKSVGADKLTLSLAPNRLDIPELRLVEPNAKLIIENDRSLNAARLLVRAATSGAAVTAPPAPVAVQQGEGPFPLRVQRLRFQNAKLDFTDLSLRPQFGAKIYELNGVITGLSTEPSSRSQLELEGRVDEFGQARITGALNPFAPADNTDVNVKFSNVDMVSASPYTMKFAGYKIAEGKISLDLEYKVHNSQLEGTNKIMIDKLTLGEKVDSPDAMKLPLELAIAILKDSDGRIDLGIPVSGNMNDPQFNYGDVVWKALGNVLTRIVTAPFRALGSLFGGSAGGEKFESVDFDPGSDKLSPPEREKIKQVAQMLSKRAQLKLSVPGQYGEAADSAAIRARLVRAEIAKRAGIKLEAGEEPGPLDTADRHVRSTMRDLYSERFGAAELDKQKKAAEGSGMAAAASSASAPADAPGTAPVDAKAGPAQDKLPLWQRVGKMAQGEPQVADAGGFYDTLLKGLDQNQPVPADALAQLGARRSAGILAALQEAGVDPARAAAAAPEKTDSTVGKPVALKLGLAAK